MALLEIYSQSLRQMTGAAIRQWLEEVGSGSGKDWFRSVAVQVVGAETGAEAVPVDSWHSFIRGWIHATAGLHCTYVAVPLIAFIVV